MSPDPTSLEATRLLVVEDEPALMAAVCNTLRDEGYEVAGVTSGAEALSVMRQGGIDLVLTDLMMPNMDGIELIRRALEIDGNVAGLVMTGHGTISTAVDAMKVGAIDYVLKPFKMSALRPALERALTIRRLRVKNAELERRVRDRTAELEAANEELEAFSYTISHDLRMPLRAINGFTELLLEYHGAALTPEIRRYFDRIRSGGLEMTHLIDAVLDFSRLGRHELVPRPVDLTALCREAYDKLENERAGRVVEFNLQSLPPVHGDPTLLRQVFINLLSNAIKYTRPRNPAVIDVGSTTSLAGEVVYFVKDNGVGFDPQYSDRLFEVFKRLHSMSDFEGTGVGLATVRRIIDRHGGNVWGESTPDRGATFSFTLKSTNTVLLQPGSPASAPRPST